jgi:catechol 2,3-dioxygenase-like lactoylglutathione lyase family enzyme
MRNLALLTCLLCLAACASAPQPASSVRPYVVALSVADLDRSIQFYAKHFGFSEVERLAIPPEGSALAFLKRDGFRIELVQIAGSAPRVTPDPNNDASLRGLVKLGFAVTGIDELTQRLQSAAVPVIVAPFDDPVRGFRGGIVRDPDGNMIGLYELRAQAASESSSSRKGA